MRSQALVTVDHLASIQSEILTERVLVGPADGYFAQRPALLPSTAIAFSETTRPAQETLGRIRFGWVDYPFITDGFDNTGTSFPSIPMRRSTAVLVILLSGFFLLKVLRFRTLSYTFHDMYGFLQMATGWLDGRPFLYENFFGFHQRIHNYYTVWLLGPVCYFLGAYGLFLVQTVLLLIAYVLTNQQLAKAGTPTWARFGLFGVVLLSPIAGWLNDHTSMGWHSELTYLPLGILFALALLRLGRWWALAAGLGVTLVKEDGAILAALIHLTYFALVYGQQHPQASLWKLVTSGRFWLIGAGWALVFLAGMIWLAYLNHFAEPRLRTALTIVSQNIDTVVFWQKAGKELATTLLLLLPPGCLIALIMRPLDRLARLRLGLLYGMGITALTVLNFIQSSYYYNDPHQPNYHLLGLTWPPRFVLLWTFTAAFLLLSLVMLPLPNRPVSGWVRVVLLVGLIGIQLPILRLTRPDLPGVAEAKAVLRGQINPSKDHRYVEPGDLATIACLAGHLPARSNVIASDFVLPYFHKHYLVWPTGHQYRLADLALVPKGQPSEWPGGIAIRRPYRTISLTGYTLYVASDYEAQIRPCLRAGL